MVAPATVRFAPRERMTSRYSSSEVGAIVGTPRRARKSRISQSHIDTVPNSEVTMTMGIAKDLNPSSIRYARPGHVGNDDGVGAVRVPVIPAGPAATTRPGRRSSAAAEPADR